MAKSSWTLRANRKTPLEMYQDLIRAQRNSDRRFRFLALVGCVGFILSLIMTIIAINQPKTVPLVVTVSDWGEAKYVGNVSRNNWQGIKVPEIAIEYQLRKFVTNFYAVPSDPQVLKNNLNDCYASCTVASSQKLSNRLRENNPLKKFGSVYRTVDIESVLRLTQESYQVDFIVNHTDKVESRNTRIRNRGVLSVKLMEPAKEDLIKNPLGIYITDFDFKELGEEK